MNPDFYRKLSGAIAVVDFGGQYAHLIASKIRKLGAYSEIVLPEEFFQKNKNYFYKGIILSGGPESVYDINAPTISKEIFSLHIPVLGICYGHQFLIHTLGGKVKKSSLREYGPAEIEIHYNSDLLKNVQKNSVVWMSHGDEVVSLPEGFRLIASTKNCKYAVVEHPEKKIFGLQFHPEVAHTREGDKILSRFIQICNLEKSWNLDIYLDFLFQYLKQYIKNKKVFFLVSGGVDSTVAFTLLGKILKPDQLYGMLIDTGFLRYEEPKKIYKELKKIGIEIHIEDARNIFYEKLKHISDPEEKRKQIGNLFIEVQQNAVKKLNLNPEEWLLGQGTIYPDTIESGSTKFSHTIKTHHNRVDVIQKLIQKELVVEPLRDLYKDEVRQIGKKLGLPEEIIEKHPFPGPGLAVRCICNGDNIATSKEFISLPEEIMVQLQSLYLKAYQLPVRSVGVQGDQRTYAYPVALFPEDGDRFITNFNWKKLFRISREIPNWFSQVNRVVLALSPFSTKLELSLKRNAFLTKERIQILQKIDVLVYEFMKAHGIYYDIWQNPVVLLPLVDSTGRESIVLRPVCSKDAMTASVYEMPVDLLWKLKDEIEQTKLISYLFYDLTTKPPGTIEWE